MFFMRPKTSEARKAKRFSRRGGFAARRLRCEPLEERRLLSVVPNDPSFGDQWVLHNTGQTGGAVDADIDAPQAWAITTGSMETVVAMLDTGIDYTHPDLYLNIWLNEAEIPTDIANSLFDIDGDEIISFRDLNASTNAAHTTDLNGNGYIDGGDLLADPRWENGQDEDGNGRIDDLVGWDYVSDDNDPQPLIDDNHGTNTALTVGAIGNNGIDGAGINWAIRMVPVRIRIGGVDIVNSQVAAGIDYGASIASIIDASFPGNPRGVSDEFSQEIFDAIDRSRQAGTLFVASPGSGSRDTDIHPWYPQSYDVDNMITSAALDETGLSLSSATNWGATTVDCAVGTYGGSGSNAVAHATGIAALVKSAHPEWTYSEIKDQMLGTVDPIPSLVGKTATGGRLNVAKAVGATYVEDLLFSDSFEDDQWNGKWVEDSQNDWFTSTQRETDGNYSAEVDGRATDATLTMANTLNLTPYSSAELTFDWYIESGLDSGEYLAIDLYDGSTWTDVARLSGNVDPEDTWHAETIAIDGAYLVSNFQFQFRANMDKSNEDANVDNVRLTAISLAGPPNQQPEAVDDSGTTDEDVAVVIDILTNDSDPDDDTIQLDSVTQGTNGSVFDNGDGTVTYNPDPDTNGVDAFTYTISDGHGGTANATVTVTVASVDDAPIADAGGPYTVVEDGSVDLDASASTDPDLSYGDTLSYAWDFDDDGAFDDATGVAPTFDATGLTAGMVVGVAVQVTDSTDRTSIDTTTVTVQTTSSELEFNSEDVPKSIVDPHPRKGTPRPVTSVLTPTELATVDLVTADATIIDAQWDDLTVTLAHPDGGSVLLTYQGGDQWRAADSTAFQGQALDRTWTLTIEDGDRNGITGTLTAWLITVTPLTEGAAASSQSAAATDMALLTMSGQDASEDEEAELLLQPIATDLALMMME
jgi:hypothetical protein